MLGVSERTFRRWTRRYEEEGEAGLADRRLGKASGRRVPADRAQEVERLYRERYQGFTVKHFHEHLIKDHGFGWGYTWLKLHLQWAGVVPKAPRKGAHRRKRERRPTSPRTTRHGEIDRGSPTQVAGARGTSSMVPAASDATMRKAGSRTSQSSAPLNSARRRACGNVDNAAALPTVPQENRTRSSGHMMCYQNRTTSFAIDR